jgi:hypothetical protein
MQIRTPDNKPVINKKLMVTISQLGVKIYEQDYTSNLRGLITIHFSPSACDEKNCKKASQLYIDVIY